MPVIRYPALSGLGCSSNHVLISSFVQDQEASMTAVRNDLQVPWLRASGKFASCQDLNLSAVGLGGSLNRDPTGKPRSHGGQRFKMLAELLHKVLRWELQSNSSVSTHIMSPEDGAQAGWYIVACFEHAWNPCDWTLRRSKACLPRV